MKAQGHPFSGQFFVLTIYIDKSFCLINLIKVNQINIFTISTWKNTSNNLDAQDNLLYLNSTQPKACKQYPISRKLFSKNYLLSYILFHWLALFFIQHKNHEQQHSMLFSRQRESFWVSYNLWEKHPYRTCSPWRVEISIWIFGCMTRNFNVLPVLLMWPNSPCCNLTLWSATL